MMGDREATAGSRSRRRKIGFGVLGLVAASVLGLGLAGLSLGRAQASTPPPDSTDTTSTTVVKPAGDFPGGGGRGGFGPGVLHGEYTTSAAGGGYQTLAVQRGEVTAVSASSITVKSEDGFSRAYGVDDNTLVNAGNEGIADVKKGDTVRVTAVVSGSTARAVDVTDATQVQESRGRWMPPRPSAPSTTSGTSSAS
ncbi:MAG: hypothetical protein WDA71_14670 [Actinomycetota bacterium]